MSNIGLIGKKVGMSREFFPIGISVPVTVIKIEKGRVLDLITKDKRGYDAIQVGFVSINYLLFIFLGNLFNNFQISIRYFLGKLPIQRHINKLSYNICVVIRGSQKFVLCIP